MPSPDTNPLVISHDSAKRLPLRKRFAKDPSVLKWQPVEMPPPTQSPPSTYPGYIPQKIEIIPMAESSVEYPPTPSSSHESPLDISAKHAESSDGDTTETDEERLGQESGRPTKKSSKRAHSWDAKERPMSPHAASSRKASWPADDWPVKKMKKDNLVNAVPSPTTHEQPNLRSSTTMATPHERSSTETTLYCICRKPYDVPRFMIACDRCDQWFHGECIGISEKQGEFIDLYFCTDCAKAIGKTTSWKPKCANSACRKAARVGTHQGHLSKYCADSCGIQVARARLELADTKRRAAGQATHDAFDHNNQTNPLSRSRLCSFADRDDRQRLLRVRDEKKRAKQMVGLVERKKTFLNALLNLNESDTRAELCGFDTRLSWPDATWESVQDMQALPNTILLSLASGQEKSFSVCRQNRRCTKHNGWQKLKASELDQERSSQFTVLSMLDRERKQIKARMQKRREEVDIAKTLANGTLCHVYEPTLI